MKGQVWVYNDTWRPIKNAALSCSLKYLVRFCLCPRPQLHYSDSTVLENLVELGDRLMKSIHNAVRLVHESFNRSDRQIVSFLITHSNLITALVTLGLAIWGLSVGHISFFVGLIIIGAISYFLGITLGLSLGVLLSVWRLFNPDPHTLWFATLLVELLGYISISWLGYRHKEQQQRQKVQEIASHHRDQVMSWAVANEIRTSLAAVRFLLFPLHDENTSHQLDTVTKELARLEELFSQMEKIQEKQVQDK